jgi:hypothetical protein
VNDDPTRPTRSSPRYTAAWGAALVLVGLLLLVSPMLLGRGVLIKYILATGFLGTCLGLTFFINGVVDWLRESRR